MVSIRDDFVYTFYFSDITNTHQGVMDMEGSDLYIRVCAVSLRSEPMKQTDMIRLI